MKLGVQVDPVGLIKMNPPPSQVDGSLLYPYASVPLCFSHSNVCISLDCSGLCFSKRAEIVQFIIDILWREDGFS